jgi:outer membrane protein TolC
MAAPVLSGWRSLYDDPILVSLIHQAVETNTDLRATSANLERSHTLPAALGDSFRPRLTARGRLQLQLHERSNWYCLFTSFGS